MQPFGEITVQVHKKDLRRHYSWKTHVLTTTPRFLCTYQSAPRSLHHQTRGAHFQFDSQSLEMFWADQWFSIGISLHPDQSVKFYCNIHEPYWLEEEELHFIDLDLDVVRKYGKPAMIVDQDEFAEHSVLFNYPESYQQKIPAVAEYLCHEINTHEAWKTPHVQSLFQSIRENKSHAGAPLAEVYGPLYEV